MELLENVTKQACSHMFTVKHQSSAIDECYSTLPQGHIISRWDFAQNAHHRRAVECQNEYFDPNQTSILTCITHYRPPGRSTLVCEEMHFIRPDLIHDSAFAQRCIDIHADHYKTLLNHHQNLILRHHVFSDGGPNYQSRHGIPINWGFTGAGHGKGPNDGADAVLKNAADLARTLESELRGNSDSRCQSFLCILYGQDAD